MSDRKDTSSLQAMRAIAAILVVLFHLTAFLHADYGYILFNDVFKYGESGVDIFFVISGFIIYYSVKVRGKYPVRRFVLSRIIRIYPIYWVVISLLIFAEFIQLTNNPHRLDFMTITSSALLLPSSPYVLSIAWTLTIEVIFYIFFTATFFVSEKTYFPFMIFWAVLSVVSDFYMPFEIPQWLSAYVLYGANVEFLFGSTIAFLFLKGTNKFSQISLFIGCIWFSLSMVDLSPFNNFGRAFSFGAPSALIIYGLLGSRIKMPNSLVKLGDSSYLLYLIHGTILSIALRITSNVFSVEYLDQPIVLITIAIMPIVAAMIGYSLLEYPLLRYLKGKI